MKDQTNDRPTPETDAAKFGIEVRGPGGAGTEVAYRVEAEVAEELERERDEAREQLDEARSRAFRQCDARANYHARLDRMVRIALWWREQAKVALYGMRLANRVQFDHVNMMDEACNDREAQRARADKAEEELAQLRLKWTKRVPSEVGWYWMRDPAKPADPPAFVHIRDYAGELAWGNYPLKNWMALGRVEWAGPCPLPEETETCTTA